MNNDSLEAASLRQAIEQAKDRLLTLLRSGSDDRLEGLAARLESEWSEHASADLLNIAFVGQYSAGKSTLISALTGRDDIEIDADIATSSATPYRWNGVTLVDTPGLYTERTDHDALTDEAIRKADLLVYCLTYMLFDDITAENFRTLAFDRGFGTKTLLTVNKVNSEPGETQERVQTYQNALTTTLAPHPVSPFRPVFVDARDYLDGLEDDDPELVEESRFPGFVKALDAFAAERGVLGRLDAPARLVKAAAHDAEIALGTTDGVDDAYLLILQRLSRVVANERERLRGRVRLRVGELTGAIVARGNKLLVELSETKDQEALFKQVELDLERAMQQTIEDIQPMIEAAAEKLQDEIDGVLEGRLATEFIASMDGAQLDRNTPGGEGAPGWLAGWKNVQGLGRKGADGVAKLAGGELGGGFLKAGGAAGSPLHKAIYAGGKMLGYNFKPWEAVNLAKTVGQVAQVAGVVIGLAAIAADAYALRQERRAEADASRARLELQDQFHSVADDTSRKFDAFLRQEVEPELFGFVDDRVDAARTTYRESTSARDSTLGQVAAVEKEIDTILARLAALHPVA